MKDGKKLGKQHMIKTGIFEVLSKVHDEVCDEVGFTRRQININFLESVYTLEERSAKMKQFDDTYIAFVCKLDTAVLEEIVRIWELGALKETQGAINAITLELIKRKVNNNDGIKSAIEIAALIAVPFAIPIWLSYKLYNKLKDK